MKKIIINFILFVIILFITLIVILSTFGIKTNKFNKLITEKFSQEKNVDLKLETIKFKINPKELSLFLETQNPEIMFKDLTLPITNIKVYVDFLSFLKTDLRIKKISLQSSELNITQLSKLSAIIKPSTFKSFFTNKIKDGKLISEIEIFLNDKGLIKDFIAKGTVSDLKIEMLNNMNLKETRLSFFADKNDILIKNIFGSLEDIKISDGDIKLNLENGVSLNSNFNSKINFTERVIKKYSKFFKNYNFLNNLKTLKADLDSNFSIEFDDTYKVKDYNYSISGEVKKSMFELSSPFKNQVVTDEITNVYLSDLKIKTIIKSKNIIINGEGKYSLDDLNFLNINIENKLNNDNFNLKLDLDYKNNVQLDLINYKKKKKFSCKFIFRSRKEKRYPQYK